MAQPRQPPGLFHQARVRAARVDFLDMEQLQRDVAVKFGVPGAEHVARGAPAYELEEDEPPPAPAVWNGGGR